MRRRNFIATLPLAASAPALAQDRAPVRPPDSAPDAPRPWIDIAAAPAMALGAAGSRCLRVIGKAEIESFGDAPEGATFLLRFAAECTLKHDARRLVLPNNGFPLLVSPGDCMSAASLGSGRWIVVSYQPATVFSKLDRRPSKGGASYRLAIGGDAGNAFPDFAVDGAYERVKTVMKSIILADPGDTTEVGAIGASGSAASATVWTGYAPLHINYAYAPQIPLDLQGAPTMATYNGRFAQEYFFQVETPTATARGGGIAWGVTMPGQIVPYDRMWLRNYGLVLPGRAAFEDSGYRFGYNYGSGGKPGQVYNHIFAPGPVNWGDVPGWGNLSLVATDEAAGCAVIAIRRNGALGTGHDWMYSLSADELRLHTVKGDVRTARWGVPVEGGHLWPVQPRTVDLGSSARPVRTVFADRLDVRRAARGPAAFIQSDRPDHEGEVLSLSSVRPPSPDFDLIRARSGDETVARFDGAGGAAIRGAWTGDGAGQAVMLEWADGNPYTEDRVGWSVAMEDGKIRRAGSQDPASAVIGVVSARPSVLANAAWSAWGGKHLSDDFGRPLTRPVEHLRWTEPVMRTQEVERTRMVKTQVRQPRRQAVEVVETIPQLVEEDGRWIRRQTQSRRTVERPVLTTVALHTSDGLPELDALGGPATAEAPVYEEVEVERPETYTETVSVQVGETCHCYPAGAMPPGVQPPLHAERVVLHEPVLNPDFDPRQAYVARQARPEWDAVSLFGPERIRHGERTGERWVFMRRVSPAVEEWLVR